MLTIANATQASSKHHATNNDTLLMSKGVHIKVSFL